MGKENNTLVIITLIVAILGGMPGIVNTISYFHEKIKSRPKLKAHISNFITGSFFKDKNITNPDAPGCHILLTITLTNSGNTPVIPAVFDMRCLIDNKWYEFERTLIQDSINLQSEIQKITLENPAQKDLQRYKKPITKTEPAYGFLMFINSELSLTKLRNRKKIPIQVICKDIFEKKYKLELELTLSGHQRPTTYPKHGVSWNFKKEDRNP